MLAVNSKEIYKLRVNFARQKHKSRENPGFC